MDFMQYDTFAVADFAKVNPTEFQRRLNLASVCAASAGFQQVAEFTITEETVYLCRRAGYPVHVRSLMFLAELRYASLHRSFLES